MGFRFTQSVNLKLLHAQQLIIHMHACVCMCIYMHIWTSIYISYMDDSFQKCLKDLL
jgi:hypothetical protein